MTSHPGPAAFQDQPQKCIQYLSRRDSTRIGTEGGLLQMCVEKTVLADVQGEAESSVFEQHHLLNA